MIRRRIDGVSAVLAFVIGASCRSLYAQTAETPPPRVVMSFESDFVSRYLFRGIPYSEGPVQQTTASVTIGQADLYTRGSLMQGGFNEIDAGVAYRRQHLKLTWAPGFDCYFYQPVNVDGNSASALPTCEASLQVRYPFGAASLFIEQMMDAGTYRGAYYGEAGISHRRLLGRLGVLESSVRLGWANGKFNRTYTGVPSARFSLIGIDISSTHAVGGHFCLKPHFELAATPKLPLVGQRQSGARVSFGFAIGYR